MDTCPFIPIRNATMDQCIQCANEFGQRLVQELDVPGRSYNYRLNVTKTKTMLIKSIYNANVNQLL